MVLRLNIDECRQCFTGYYVNVTLGSAITSTCGQRTEGFMHMSNLVASPRSFTS